MEIKEKKQKEFLLEYIKPGECFVYKNEVYLKIKETEETYQIGNAVRLHDGFLTGISPKFTVTPVKAEVYLEYPVVVCDREKFVLEMR